MVALTTAMTSHCGDLLAAEARGAATQGSVSGQAEMRPVPKFSGTSLRDPRRGTASSGSTNQLPWRTSSQVAPPAATASVSPAHPAVSPLPLSHGQLLPQRVANAVAPAVAPAVTSAIDPQPVRQVQFEVPPVTPAPQGPETVQPSLQLPPALEAPPTADRALPDFFAEPFGGRGDANATPPAELLPPPAMQPAQPLPAQPAQPRQQEIGPGADEPPAQSTQLPAPEQSPFDLRTSPTPRSEDIRSPRALEDFDLPPRGNGRRSADPVAPAEDITLIRPVAFSCDDFRQSIAAATIQKLSLDISPPFRPDVIQLDEFRKLKERFNEQQVVRDWQSIDGRKLGRGRMRDLAYENVIIETEFGTLEEVPVNRLSEADLAYVSSQWGLPQDCLIEQPEYQSRSWTPSQITWKASNLVHKPLYFEEVNLERYGHTAGPLLQPVISSAHFFANIAVMPYKMGVHSPHECQYALGYYRPGNCAPWITPPVPLSLRGALFQAAAMTGNVLLIP